MSEHRAKINWTNNAATLDYETYTRNHIWSFTGGQSLPASAAPEYQGTNNRLDPEKAFVAALSSCHMLTFLAIAAKKRLNIEQYVDNAVGVLEKNAAGKTCITRVTLNPQVTWAKDTDVTAEQLKKLHDSAHNNCFIANSVQADVDIHLG